ncbi:TonB-dependent receptor [Alteromonas sp. ASW11-36]|uniref:TonB-dependent receptor n=1 Tax=Alteromonas arenosi TaxID=3055817 RepID=A0ABT7T1P1_9ALTE|nr:TonB-dependent receptor [Alteromonas sp. ASW11-36]MDM7861722.1 TonB-dependent receptor [Alteromonas sp. ASW11-36]
MKYTHILATTTVAITSALVPATSLAQTTTTASLERISIVGSRSEIKQNKLAAASYIIDEQAIQNAGQPFLIDLLRGLPGISVAQSGSVGGLTELRLRGAESNHVLVLIDGVVVNDESQGGLVDFAHLTTANIVSVELLQGPQSALWGSGAVAGVISIKTRNGDAAQRNVRINVGNNSEFGVGGTLGGQQQDVTWLLDAQHISTDGQNVARQGDEDDGYKNTTLSANLNWQINEKQSLAINLRGVDYQNDFDAVDFFTTGLPVDADNTTEGKQLSANIHWQLAQTDSLSHNLIAQYSDNDSENFAAGVSTGDTNAQKLRLGYYASYASNLLESVNLGIEHVTDDFAQGGPIGFGDPNQTQSVDTLAVFGDAVVNVNSDWSVNGSLRLDNNSDFDDQTSYRLGLNYQISRQWSWFISQGEAVRNPTFTERFGFFPQSFIGNAELQPETAKTLETGIRFIPHAGVLVQLNAFDSELENEINGFVFEPLSGLFTATNRMAMSEREGLELMLEQTLSAFKVSANYSYVDASELSDTEFASVELRRPRHTGSVRVNYLPSNSPIKANLQLDYTGSRIDQFFPPFPQPAERVDLRAYWLVNATVTYQFSDSATVQFSAHNLFDHEYEDVVGFVGEGLQWRVNTQYRF